MNALTFSFDIGYASIGWAVLEAAKDAEHEPLILGCGSVIFPKDDCAAYDRRNKRRLRRNIRSRRVRIERMGRLLVHAGVITQEQKKLPGHPAPFYLAAEVLSGRRTLTGLELWHVLRWYAHNRGYDNNVAWANSSEEDNPDSKDDTEKLKNANDLMQKHGTHSMAETICHELNLTAKKASSYKAYKTLNIAFRRDVVQNEVLEILRRSVGNIPNLTEELSALIAQKEELSALQLEQLRRANIKLARRYKGSLLFGQLIPRFDNRIISKCPITWANVYEAALREGSTEQQARKKADKYSKVPSANCREFYEYRMARILCNLRANDLPLSAELRRQLMELARKDGKLTKSALNSTIEKVLDTKNTNVSNYFTLHPDSQEALYLDPAVEALQRSGLREYLSTSVEHIALNRLRRGKIVTPNSLVDLMRAHGEETEKLEKAIEDKQSKAKKGKKKEVSKLWGDTALSLDVAEGRAPYAKEVLRQVVAEVLVGEDPTRPAKDDAHPDGEEKAAHGCLYCLMDPKSKVTEYLQKRRMDELTNNHLVRHRMLIFGRLINDLVKDYAGGDATKVKTACIEVGKELREFSGMSSQDIQKALGAKLKSHKEAVLKLEKDLAGTNIPITASLIRKCKIAQDMKWTCPYTLQDYGPHELEDLEWEHIVPHAFRQSDALSSLALTWPEVNKLKGRRTGYDFIKQEEGRTIVVQTKRGCKKNLSICSINNYEKNVKFLEDPINKKRKDPFKDDKMRKNKRCALLLVKSIDNKSQAKTNIGMTEGMMTQSSQLMKLASRVVTSIIPNISIDKIPGTITGIVAKSWDVFGCLATLCPEKVRAGNKIIKGDLRDCTHLHHAVDACVLGLIPHLIPEHRNGILRKALAMRHLPKEEAEKVRKEYNKRYYGLNTTDKGSRLSLNDLPASIKENIRERLLEQRVVQHVPADMSGASLKETIQRVVAVEGEGVDAMVTLQRSSTQVKEDGTRKRTFTTNVVKASKVMGLKPKCQSKLKPLKAAIEVDSNYGVALDPIPSVLRHVSVYRKLKELKKQNGGNPVRVLKNGMLITLFSDNDPKRNGIWRIASIKDAKNGVTVDLQRAHFAGNTSLKHINNWREVLLVSLIKKYNLKLIRSSYSGTPR